MLPERCARLGHTHTPRTNRDPWIYAMLIAATALVILAALVGGCAVGPDGANPLLPTTARPVREGPVPPVMQAWREWFVRQAANDETIKRIVSDRGIAESARFTPFSAEGTVVDVYFTAAEAVPGGAALWKAAYTATWEPDGEGWTFAVRDELRRQDPVAATKREGATY